MEFYNEEYMVQLASDMSLVDGVTQDWNPHDLAKSISKITDIEQYLDNYVVSSSINDFDINYARGSSVSLNGAAPLSSDPMSDLEVQELFMSSDQVPHENEFISSSYTSDQGANFIYAGGTNESFSRGGSPDPFRNSGKNTYSKPTPEIESAIRKLKWFQNKIMHHLQTSDEGLELLLEMMEKISLTLGRVEDKIGSKKMDAITQDGVDDSEAVHDDEGVAAMGNRTHGFAAADASHGVLSTIQNISAQIDKNLYALRRGGDRNDIFKHVQSLKSLCNSQDDLHLFAIKHMLAGGALQSLLTTLGRCGEWPEVELMISKTVCVLVTYEDDWGFLQRSAFVILSSLYSLQLKTLARSQSNFHYQNYHQQLSNGRPISVRSSAVLDSGGLVPGSSLEGSGQYSNNINDNSNSNRSEASSGSSDSAGSGGIFGIATTNSLQQQHHSSVRPLESISVPGGDDPLQSKSEPHSLESDVRVLLSAALAKLSLVLCYEWGGQGGAESNGSLHIGSGIGSGWGPMMMMPSSVASSSAAAASAVLSPSIVDSTDLFNLSSHGSRQRAHSSAAGSSSVDPSRILSIIVNLIITIASVPDTIGDTGSNSAMASIGRNSVHGIGGAAGGGNSNSRPSALNAFSTLSSTASLPGTFSKTNSRVFTSDEFGCLPPPIPPSELVGQPVFGPTFSRQTTDSPTALESSSRRASGMFRTNSAKDVFSSNFGAVGGIGSGVNISSSSSIWSDGGIGDGGVGVAETTQLSLQQWSADMIFNCPAVDQADSCAVLCSAALCNLAEIPDCRPGLVSGGVLKLVRSWLEIGADVLLHMRLFLSQSDYLNNACSSAEATPTSPSFTQRSSDPSSSHNNNDSTASQVYFERFVKTFSRSFELITNAAAILMFLSGGSDRHQRTTVSHSAAAAAAGMPRTGDRSARRGDRVGGLGGQTGGGGGGGSGYEYSVGWIDAQILAEGLPAAVVKIILASTEVFVDRQGSDREQAATRSVLPISTAMHLSEFLFQLADRVQNRPQLNAANVPYALCCMFENLSAAVKKYVHTTVDTPHHTSDNQQIADYIFHFGGVYYESKRASKSGSGAAKPKAKTTSSAVSAVPATGSSAASNGSAAAPIKVPNSNSNSSSHHHPPSQHGAAPAAAGGNYANSNGGGGGGATSPLSGGGGGGGGAVDDLLSLYSTSINTDDQNRHSLVLNNNPKQHKNQSQSTVVVTTDPVNVVSGVFPAANESKLGAEVVANSNVLEGGGGGGGSGKKIHFFNNKGNKGKKEAVGGEETGSAAVAASVAAAAATTTAAISTIQECVTLKAQEQQPSRGAGGGGGESKVMDLFASITASCFFVLKCFGDEELKLFGAAAAVNGKSGSGSGSGSSSSSSSSTLPRTGAVDINGMMAQNSSIPAGPDLPLLELLIHQRVLDGILLAATSLESGEGRMATLRLIASMTSYPPAMDPLFQCGLSDALLYISQEARNRQVNRHAMIGGGGHRRNTSNGQHSEAAGSGYLSYISRNFSGENIDWPLSSSQAVDSSPMQEGESAVGTAAAGGGQAKPPPRLSLFGFGKPQKVERASSNVSSNSALSSQEGGGRPLNAKTTTKHHYNNNRYRESYSYNRGNSSAKSVGSSSVASGGGARGRQSNSAFDQPSTPRSGMYDAEGLDMCVWDDDDDRLSQSQRSSHHYAHQDYDHALRKREEEEAALVCFSLANISIASDAYAQQLFRNGLLDIMTGLTKSEFGVVAAQAVRCISALCPAIASEAFDRAAFVKPNFFQEVLDSLSTALKYHNAEVQRGALSSMAQLALMDESVRHGIVASSLRRIVNLMMDPRNERSIKDAAEEVLKSIGFHGGYKDLEVCGFDSALLVDWYSIKRSLKPQDAAHDILIDWLDLFFSGTANGVAGASSFANPQQQQKAAVVSPSSSTYSAGSGELALGTMRLSDEEQRGVGGFVVGGNNNNTTGRAASPSQHILFHAHSERFFHSPSMTGNSIQSAVGSVESGDFYLHHQRNKTELTADGLKNETESILNHSDMSSSEESSTDDEFTDRSSTVSAGGVLMSSSSGRDSGSGMPRRPSYKTRRSKSTNQSSPQHISSSGSANPSPRTSTAAAASSSSSSGGLASSAKRFLMPTLQRTVSDTLSRFLPFCKPAPMHSTGFEHGYSNSSGGGISPGGASHTINRGGTDHHLAAIDGLVQTPLDAYDYLDVPPLGVKNMLKLFHSSRLQRHLIMDLPSLGQIFHSATMTTVNPLTGMEEKDFSSVTTTSGGELAAALQPDEESCLVLPRPHPVSAILLPSRPYATFTRVGKVLERMLEYDETEAAMPVPVPSSMIPTAASATSATKAEQKALDGKMEQIESAIEGSVQSSKVLPQLLPFQTGTALPAPPTAHKLWSISFVDSEFGGDFHTTLLATLRRCPQICSLSFSHVKRVEEDALLGNICGQLPPTVKFLSFKSTLSNESVQALCILLKSSNEQLNNPHRARGAAAAAAAASRSRKSSPAISTSSQQQQQSSSSSSNQSYFGKLQLRQEQLDGLYGLALTHLAPLDSSALDKVVELLMPGRSPTTSSRNPRAAVSPPETFTEGLNRQRLRGLRYIDLSNNGLSDEKCARVLTAALLGPLEGLELGHNNICHGEHFGRALEPLQGGNVRGSLLTYLSLSNNKLAKSLINKCLSVLSENNTMTYLDLSLNRIDVIGKDRLRMFIEDNCTLRALDLSATKLTPEFYKQIHLGLLNNDALLMLPLAGNPEVMTSPTVKLIQSRLRDNRIHYNRYARIRPLPYHNAPPVCTAAPATSKPLAALAAAALLQDDEGDEQQEEEQPISPAAAVSATPFSVSGHGDEDAAAAVAAVASIVAGTGAVDPITAYATATSVVVDVLRRCDIKKNGSSIERTGEKAAAAAGEVRGGTDDKESVQNAVAIKANAAAAAAPSSSSVSGLGTLHIEHPAHTTTTTTTTTNHLSSSSSSAAAAAATAVMNNNCTVDDDCSVSPLSTHLDSTPSPFDYQATVDRPAAQLKLIHPAAEMHPVVANDHTLPVHHTEPPSLPDKAVATATTAAPVKLNNPTTVNQMIAPPKLLLTRGRSASAPSPADLRTMRINNANSFKNGKNASDLPPEAAAAAAAGATSGNALTSSSSSSSSLPGAAKSPPSLDSNTLHVFFSAPLAGKQRDGGNWVAIEMLDYAAERDMLMQVFREVRRDVCVHFHTATSDSIRTAITLGCKALHFSGHGIPNGLCFEDGRSGLQLIGANTLQQLLGAGRQTLEFVFVSACHSRAIGDAFVKAGIKHVVCVKIDSKIQDAAAIAFTRAFYIAILNGETVSDSFSIAKEALKASPFVANSNCEGNKFVLLPEDSSPTATATEGGAMAASDSSAVVASSPLSDGGGTATPSSSSSRRVPLHEQSIFSTNSVSKWPMPGQCVIGPSRCDVSVFLSRCRLPSPPTDFEGREVIMHTLIKHILDRRLISLVGEDGVGKTSVASAVCKYITDREMFPDSIVYLRAKGLKDFKSFLKALERALLSSSVVGPNMQILLERATADLAAAELRAQAAQVMYVEEDVILELLESKKLLLVLDNLDDLTASYSEYANETITDMRLFLGRLFQRCGAVKVLVVSTDTLSMHNISIPGVIEHSVMLGPLTLYSSLRLFARLAPPLFTSHNKTSFVEEMLPRKQLMNQIHVTVHSRELTTQGRMMLELFGRGHPAKIVLMACESTAESIEKLKQKVMRILEPYGPLLR